MAIVDLQRRARQLGKIRIGQVVPTSNGKTRPDKLDKFRLTSASRPLLEKVAELYGGTVESWTPQGGGPTTWQVLTTSNRLPVLVPPQPVSQFYELWDKSGCVRRCDGRTELREAVPCICGPDPEERECKPTTRLNVILRDVEGIGVWLLESHGWYAAVELPDVADFLAQSGGYVEAHLALEERVVKRDGKTKRFMVPTLEVGVTPAQLMAGNGAQQISGPAPRELSVAPRAIESAPAPTPTPAAVTLDVESVRNAILTAGSLDDLRAMWPEVKAAGLDAEAMEVVKGFQAAEKGEPDGDVLWSQIMQSVPEDWTSTRVEKEFHDHTGVLAEDADPAQLAAYLTHIRAAS